MIVPQIGQNSSEYNWVRGVRSLPDGSTAPLGEWFLVLNRPLSDGSLYIARMSDDITHIQFLDRLVEVASSWDGIGVVNTDSTASFGSDGDDVAIMSHNTFNVAYSSLGADYYTFDGTNSHAIRFVDYEFSNGPVYVDLAQNIASGGHAQGDRFNNINEIRGSQFSDILVGDSENNRLSGAGGNDQLYGGDGQDTLFGGANDDMLYGGSAANALFGGSGHDAAFISIANEDRLTNTDALIFSVTATDGAGDLRLGTGRQPSEFQQLDSIESIQFGSGGAFASGPYVTTDNIDDTGLNAIFGAYSWSSQFRSLTTINSAGVSQDNGLTVSALTNGQSIHDRLNPVWDVVNDIDAFHFNDRSVSRSDVVTNGEIVISNAVLPQAGFSGTSGDDIYVVSGFNSFEGSAGADSFISSNAGAGSRVSYHNSTSGLTINLADPDRSTGDAKGDIYQNVIVEGSTFRDIILGSSGADRISISGGGDWVFGQGGNDEFYASLDGAYISGGSGVDTVFYSSNIDFIVSETHGGARISSASNANHYDRVSDNVEFLSINGVSQALEDWF